MYASIS
jgi:hypothetical protein